MTNEVIVGIDHQDSGRYIVSVIRDDDESPLLYHHVINDGFAAKIESERLGDLLEAIGMKVRYWLKKKGEAGEYYHRS